MAVLNFAMQVRYLNSVSALITRPHRLNYLKTYPTVIINTDGSSINVRYEEPRRIIKVLSYRRLSHYYDKVMFLVTYQYMDT